MFNKNQARYFVSIIIILIILLIYKGWFLFNPLSAGDWGFFYNSSLKEFSVNLSSWNSVFNSGLGGSNLIILGLFFYFSSTIYLLFNFFKFDWLVIERIAWFWPFLIISFFSSHLLFKKLFSSKFAVLSSFLYLFNTYILMLVGGGQMGIALAYSIAPLALVSFIKVTDVILSSSQNIKYQISNIKYAIIAGLLLSILVIFDLRIAYISLAAVATYAVLRIVNYVLSKGALRKKIFYILYLIFYIFIIPGVLSFLLNSFWIMPLISGGKNPLVELGDAYSSLESVKFFSFAKFEDSFSLLHPNWSENIFGKVGFMRAEFLILPILAFSSLLFVTSSKLKNNLAIEQSNNRTIIFFALLGLIGAFLAKGANEPFGGIYLWMFDYVPGFIMFRDPTKWYTLVAISYSILIPFTVWKVYELLKSQLSVKGGSSFGQKIQKFMPSLFLILTFLYLILLIRPALLGQLTGTFKSTQVPSDYIKLEKFISKDPNFYRTLWVPTAQRFGYYSNAHPAIPANDFFKTSGYSNVLQNIGIDKTKNLLQESAAKYVIVPFDSEGEIFLRDRKYNNDIYQKTINEVKQIPYLRQVSGFGKIAVFEIPNPKDHFYISNQQSPVRNASQSDAGGAISNQKITYRYVSPVEYKLELKNARKGDVIVFSESYDARWVARDNDTKFYDWSNLIGSDPYERRFNSFTLRKGGDYSMVLYYYPQILVNIGIVISGLTLVLILSALIYSKRRKI